MKRRQFIVKIAPKTEKIIKKQFWELNYIGPQTSKTCKNEKESPKKNIFYSNPLPM